MAEHLVIGSRGSRLALWQAEWARKGLLERRPDRSVEIQVIQTKGDRLLSAPFSTMSRKGVFTKEIDNAVLDSRVDLAVHSLKDLPTDLPKGLKIGAVGPRADVRDALVSRKQTGLAGLREGARVGTSSLRRQAQLLHIRPDLRIEGLRGNVETRIRSLTTKDLDAVVLAAAGLSRLDLAHTITEYLAADLILPAPGQGAMAITVREADEPVSRAVSDLEDPASRRAAAAERSLLRALDGGCQIPIGAWAREDEKGMVLDGLVAMPDGSRIVRGRTEGGPSSAEEIGRTLSGQLLDAGARDVLARVRSGL